MGELEILKQRVEDLTGDLSRMDKLLTVTAHQRNEALARVNRLRTALGLLDALNAAVKGLEKKIDVHGCGHSTETIRRLIDEAYAIINES